MKLEAGDQLKTGGNGTALLLFFEGSTMEVQADTEILINEMSLSGTGSTTIGLKQLVGNTVNRVQKLVDSESKYEVETPAASAVVRGTIFTVLVGIDGNTTLNSEEGDVGFTANNVTVLVGTGMQSSACVGCTPSNPLPASTPGPTYSPITKPIPTSTPAPTAVPLLTPLPAIIVPGGGGSNEPTPTPTPTPFVQVQITSPQDGSATDNRLLTVSGNVTSTNEVNSETGATITLNGEAGSLLLTLQGNSTYDYSFSTQVELIPGNNTITVAATDISGQTGNDTVTVNSNIQLYAIKAELTWDTNNTDLDSHLIAPCYAENDSFGDCYYDNRNPNWSGNSASNPSLDQDVTTGYGPEYIVLQSPPFNGIYQYKVYYYSDHGNGNSMATVRIWINDELVFQGNRTLSNQEWWDCASIDWPSGNVTAGYPTHTLTVTSNGCCPILVEGLSCGNRTVSAGDTTAFSTPENGNVTLTAETGEGCSFDQWQVDGGNSTGGNSTTVTMDSDHVVTATCTPLYTLTVTSSGCCPITVELPEGNQTVDPGNSTPFYGLPENTQVTLTAQSGVSCQFDGWTIDDAPREGNPTTVTMDSDHVVTATCTPLYTLTVTSSGCCPITVELPEGNQTVPAGNTTPFYGLPEDTQVTLTAQSDDSCQFENWTVDDQQPDTNQTITVTMDSDHIATATCTPLYTLTVTSNGCCPITVELPEGNQTVDPGNSTSFYGLPENTQVTLTAESSEDCNFSQWQVDGGNSTEENPIIVAMNSDHEATAVGNLP
jgi:uncharacterized protein YfaP (DUF2135 family)